MTRQEKSKAISELTEKLGASTNLYLTDISGLDAQATSNLRRACYKANISLSMTKNTFLDKAMQASEKDFGDLSTILKGNTSIMFSEVGNAPAKVIKTFRKKSEKPVLKGAYIEENIYGNRDVAEYIKGNSLFQVLESDKLKEDIRDRELDMWNY